MFNLCPRSVFYLISTSQNEKLNLSCIISGDHALFSLDYGKSEFTVHIFRLKALNASRYIRATKIHRLHINQF